MMGPEVYIADVPVLQARLCENDRTSCRNK